MVPALPRRRSTGLTALGFILVAVGAILAYLVFSTTGVSHPYLALTHNVSRPAQDARSTAVAPTTAWSAPFCTYPTTEARFGSKAGGTSRAVR